jgi:hypothetical protein
MRKWTKRPKYSESRGILTLHYFKQISPILKKSYDLLSRDAGLE